MRAEISSSSLISSLEYGQRFRSSRCSQRSRNISFMYSALPSVISRAPRECSSERSSEAGDCGAPGTAFRPPHTTAAKFFAIGSIVTAESRFLPYILALLQPTSIRQQRIRAVENRAIVEICQGKTAVSVIAFFLDGRKYCEEIVGLDESNPHNGRVSDKRAPNRSSSGTGLVW